MSAKVAVVIFKPGYNRRTDYAGVKWLSGFGESGVSKPNLMVIHAFEG